MQTRRSYLAAVGVTLATAAGCLGDDDPAGGGDDETTDRPTATPTERPTGTPGTTTDPLSDVTVSEFGVRDAVTFYTWPASTQVLAPPDRQFVLATVDGPDDATVPDFSFEAGGESWSPGVGDRSVHRESVVDGRPRGFVTSTEGANGFLAFTVPAPLEASNPRITASDDETVWTPDDATRDRLATPSPAFELETLDVPDSVTQPETLDVSLTVTNTSEVDGRFLAAVHWPTRGIADDDESTILERSVDAGATAEFSPSLRTAQTVVETDTVPLTVGGYAEAERTVEVVAEDA